MRVVQARLDHEEDVHRHRDPTDRVVRVDDGLLVPVEIADRLGLGGRAGLADHEQGNVTSAGVPLTIAHAGGE